MKKNTFIIYILLFALLIEGCNNKIKSPQSTSFFALDTLVTITVYDDRQDIPALFEGSKKLVEGFEALFSRTLEGSDVYNINHSEADPVKVSGETILLVEEGLKYSEMTDGLFNICISPLKEVWDSTTALPEKEDIEKALDHISTESIITDRAQSTITLKDPLGGIDLGAIAKGYIADRLKEYLLSENIDSAIIDLGGNILTIGTKPDGSPFNVGIKNPLSSLSNTLDNSENERGAIALGLKISDLSVVTSGIYERYRMVDGRLFHHVLNPETGFPSDNSLASVSIISKSSMDGDALSTSCLLLGREKGLLLIESLPDIEAIFIEKDGTTSFTSGMEKYR